MKQNSLHEYLMADIFGRMPEISYKQMFGGYGYYFNGIFFAILTGDKLFFKVGDSNRSDFEKIGSHPFSYQTKTGKVVTMSYWELPIDILEDPEALPVWIEKSVRQNLKL